MIDGAPTPPDWFGTKTWPIRVTERKEGKQVERTVQTIYPPFMVGVPGVITDEFVELQAYEWAVVIGEHPEYFCVDCRSVFVGCLKDDKGKNVRDARDRLVMAKRCGPCSQKRKAASQGGRGTG